MRHIETLPRNFDPQQARPVQSSRRATDWKCLEISAVVATAPPGSPRPGGSLERAQELLQSYAFSDPSLVEAFFTPEQPLLHRPVALMLKALGLTLLCGLRVTRVLNVQDTERTRFGFRCDTLQGHIESGYEWLIVEQDHASGAVTFRIASLFRPGQFPNRWIRWGFGWLGPLYQQRWLRRCLDRMRVQLAHG